MALIFHLFVIALFLVICILTEPIIYNRYRLYKIVPRTEKQMKFMKDSFWPNEKFDFWSRICLNCDVVVLVHPLEIPLVEKFLIALNVDYEVYVNNIAEDLIAPEDNNFWDSLYLREVIKVHLGSGQAELLEPYKNKTGIRLFSKLESDSKKAEFLVRTGFGDEFFEFLDKNNMRHEQILKDIGVWLNTFEDYKSKPKKPKNPQGTKKPKRHHFVYAATM